jgi:hypothetical protein
MYIYDKTSSSEIKITPRTILPYALLTFERIDSNETDTLVDIFDIDSKLMKYKPASSDIDINISKSRVYYEHNGHPNVKFRGTSKLKIKLTDILKSNMKFLDDDKTSISLTNSTNRLLLTYMDKRKKLSKQTTSKAIISQDDVLNNKNNNNHANGKHKVQVFDNKKILTSKPVELKLEKPVVKPPVVNPDQPKLNKKVFSQNTQLINKNVKQEAVDVNKAVDLSLTTTTASTSPAIASLNSGSTSLEKHLMKSRKNLAAAITATTSARLSAPPSQIKPQNNTQKLVVNQQRMFFEIQNKKLEAKKKEEQLRQKLVKSFWNGDEWKNILQESTSSYLKQFYDQLMTAMESEMRRYSYLIVSVKPKQQFRHETVKIDVENVNKIEAYNPKKIFSGGFCGIEAGKCGNNLKNELDNCSIKNNNQTATALPVHKKIQLIDYTTKVLKATTDNESIVSINSNSMTPVVVVAAAPVPVVTISSQTDTTPFTRQSSSSNLYSNVVVGGGGSNGGGKEEAEVGEKGVKRKLPSISLIDELKKRISSSSKVSKSCDNSQQLNNNSSSTDSGESLNQTTLKRKHKSRKISKSIKHSKNRSASNDTISSNNSHVNNNNNNNCIKLNNTKLSKKRKKSKKHKIKKSRSSSISSSYSSFSSSSSSISTGISFTSSLSKNLKIEPNNFDSDTKISLNSTTTTTLNPHDFVNNNNSKIVITPTSQKTSDSIYYKEEDSYYDNFYNEYDLSIQSLVASSNSEPILSSKLIENPTKSVLSACTLTNPSTPSPRPPSLPRPLSQNQIVTPPTIRTRLLPSSVPTNINMTRQQNQQFSRASQNSSFTSQPLNNNVQQSRFRINNIKSFNANDSSFSFPLNFQSQCGPIPKNFNSKIKQEPGIIGKLIKLINIEAEGNSNYSFNFRRIS